MAMTFIWIEVTLKRHFRQENIFQRKNDCRFFLFETFHLIVSHTYTHSQSKHRISYYKFQVVGNGVYDFFLFLFLPSFYTSSQQKFILLKILYDWTIWFFFYFITQPYTYIVLLSILLLVVIAFFFLQMFHIEYDRRVFIFCTSLVPHIVHCLLNSTAKANQLNNCSKKQNNMLLQKRPILRGFVLFLAHQFLCFSQ